MAILNLDALLAEVSPDQPVGENLEYDSAFVELERAAEDKPEQSLGDATVAGEPADWKTVKSGCIELLSRTKDLRLAVMLTRSLINVDGWPGLSEGLTFTRSLLETYWESLHPELDPDDDNDPTLRVNTLATLRDRSATLNFLLDAPLASVKGIGSFSLRDHKVASGELSAPADAESSPPDAGIIAAAFMDCDINALKSLAADIAAAQEQVKAIDALLMDKVGSAGALDLALLSGLINDAGKLVNENLGRRGEVVETDNSANADAAADGQSAPAAKPVAVGTIQSREDAARMMDKISEYFMQHEPSSPVPLLMQRAKRISNLGFLEILKDLAPDGLSQAQNIGGVNSVDGD